LILSSFLTCRAPNSKVASPTLRQVSSYITLRWPYLRVVSLRPSRSCGQNPKRLAGRGVLSCSEAVAQASVSALASKA